MRTSTAPFFFLIYLITTTTVNAGSNEANCSFDHEKAHIPPPDWQDCTRALADLPISSIPETIPERINWPVAVWNDECTIILKPNVHPKYSTPGQSINWDEVYSNATELIFKCFRHATPAHISALFMKGFLNTRHGFRESFGQTGLAIIILSTPYDKAKHHLARSNAGYVRLNPGISAKSAHKTAWLSTPRGHLGYASGLSENLRANNDLRKTRETPLPYTSGLFADLRTKHNLRGTREAPLAHAWGDDKETVE